MFSLKKCKKQRIYLFHGQIKGTHIAEAFKQYKIIGTRKMLKT